ncbi:MAG: GNAT family N-acetyltransferase [Phycisphaerales bacterium]
MTSLVCETHRARIEQIGPRDVEDMHLVYGDPLVVGFVDNGEPLDRAGCVRWVEVTEANVRTRGYGMCIVRCRETRELIGFIGLVHPGGQEVPEIKYALRPQWWGRGYASELVAGLTSHGITHLGMDRIIATVHPENTASARVLKRCGYRLIETRTNEDGSETLVFGFEPSR